VAEPSKPAFYARKGSLLSDWWTLLHPPYTLWHLSYVVIGAAVVPARDWGALAASVLAFFLAVGLAAHALDEVQGRPLGTDIGSATLYAVAVLGLGGACVLGVAGAFFRDGRNWPLAAVIPLGILLVVGYNLELFGGRLHTDWAFAWGWGGFPVVVGYLAQSPSVSLPQLVAVTAATLAGVSTSYAQRFLSTPARHLRRRTVEVTGNLAGTDGTATPLDRNVLLAPLEGALRALSWAMPMFALAMLLART
jgi:hypothetical protein